MALSERCCNCAYACLISRPNVRDLTSFFCVRFSEVTDENETCSVFITHIDAKFCYALDYEAKTTIKYTYPFKY